VSVRGLGSLDTRNSLDLLPQFSDALVGPPFINVMAAPFFAKGDGATDDTAAIQAAIDATPAGGIVFFPPGNYKFSTLTRTSSPIHLMGGGYMQNVQAAFGNAAYGTLSNFGGTVLISTATSGTALTLGDGVTFRKGMRLTGFALIGPGSGTSTGILLDKTLNTRVTDVQVANFSLGWDVDFTLDSLFSSARSMGCSTGFKVQALANQNTWVDTEVQFSSADGIYVTGSTGNRFVGGLCQNISGTAGIRCDISAGEHTFDGFWFEAVTATNAVKFGPTGVHGNSLWNSTFAGDGGLISIEGNLCVLGRNRALGTPGGNITIVSGSIGTFVIAPDGVTITDNGTNSNVWEYNRSKFGAEVEIDGALNHDGTTAGFFGKVPATQRPANADTSGATLAALETEVNELKQLLRDYGLLAT
jgi:hypothetical protein